jgi:serine/threonine protein phosphatase PrpC
MMSSWRVVSASVAGSSHLAKQLGCDDAHALRRLSDGSVLLAVADGAGSAVRASEGAHLAVQIAVDVLANSLTHSTLIQPAQAEFLLKATLQQVHATLENLAGGANLSDFATTLLLVFITPQWLAVAQVGDGAIVVAKADLTFEALTKPSHSEYINETSFITSANYLEQAQYVIQAAVNIKGVAMFSDGLQMLALSLTNNVPHPPFFEPLFRFVANPQANEESLNIRLASFLDSERICAATDDDKTLVLALKL